MPRLQASSKKRIRSLRQYAKMTDEEFDDLWETKLTGVEGNKEFENRIQRKIDDFSKDYDIDDLKINDMLTLRALAQAYITLEDLENYSYRERVGGISEDKILSMEKINNMMTTLRRDISNMQNDLKITRKVRKGDKEESVINYIEDLKLKAKKFYDQKMSYVFCPKCNMLLATVWTLYPYGKNKITLTCNRKLQNGDLCNTTFTVSSKELVEKRGSNNQELLPESFA